MYGVGNSLLFNILRLSCFFDPQLLSAVNCWLKCMLLDPYNQTDHPECKSRPDSGLSAITELDPGYITGIFFFLFCFFLISRSNASKCISSVSIMLLLKNNLACLTKISL